MKFVAVEASSGAMGGSQSHEFMVSSEAGEDYVVICDATGYAANLERFDGRLAELLPRLAPSDLLVITADHGPAVSGAHNAIVAARAGKDLISAVVSGLLTIGPRFGGAAKCRLDILDR